MTDICWLVLELASDVDIRALNLRVCKSCGGDVKLGLRGIGDGWSEDGVEVFWPLALTG